MKEEHIWTKKPETMLDWFCVVGACIALYLALNNLGYFLGKIGVFIGIVSPFAGGIVIAYVLDPMVKFFYTKLFKEKKKTRGFAILLAYLVAILLLVLLAWLVIPQIVDSIAMLFTNFPSYIHSVQDMLGMVQERFGVDLSSATKVLDDSEAMVKEIYNMASAAMPQIVASIGSVASNFVAIFTSIAASIYMLADKEHLLHQLRTLAHAFLPEKAAENTLRICHYSLWARSLTRPSSALSRLWQWRSCGSILHCSSVCLSASRILSRYLAPSSARSPASSFCCWLTRSRRSSSAC